MLRKNTSTILALATIMIFTMTAAAWADSTVVLPKGRSSFSLSYFYDDITREFDDAGSNRELGYFLNVDITQIGEAVLQEQVGPLPFSILDEARIFVDADVHVEGLAFSYQYGLTDNLSMGIGFPYFLRANSNIDFDVTADFSDTAETFLVAPGVSLADAILAQASPKQLAQNYLHDQLGYKKVGDFEGTDQIGDVIVGAKYRFLNEEMWKAAAGGFVSIPTGKPDDERNLTDIAYGSGSWMTGFYLMADWTPAEWLAWNATGAYVVDYPYHRGIYYLDKDNPLFYHAEFPTKHAFGDFDRGDYYDLGTEVFIKPYRGIDLFVAYNYLQSESDKLDDMVLPKTIRIEQKMTYGVAFSTVEAYMAKEAKVPMSFEVSYEPVISGKNVEQSNRWFGTLAIYF